MKDRYYVICVSDDGDISASCYTKEELEDKLNNDYWGGSPRTLTPIADMNSKSGIMIIKGVQVEPTPVEKVQRWGV